MRILAVAAGTLLALLMGELVVRVLRVPPFPLAALDEDSYRLSDYPGISYEYIPGFTPSPVDSNGFRDGINRAGFRDRDHDAHKPAGTYRIIVLGDSTTAGNGVPYVSDTYTKQLELLLNTGSDGATDHEVLNMAVGGYHTLQEVETLRVRGLQYCPDMVLLTVCLNDFEPGSDGGVYSRLVEEEATGRVGPGYGNLLLRHSRMAFVLYHRLKPRRAVSDAWYNEHLLRGRTAVEAGLQSLSELQQEHGFPVFVLILPAFPPSLDRYRYMDIHEKVFDAAAGLPGITVIDLLDDFRSVDVDGAVFSDGEVHMNEFGHRTMAEILVRRLGSEIRSGRRIECPDPSSAPPSRLP